MHGSSGVVLGKAHCIAILPSFRALLGESVAGNDAWASKQLSKAAHYGYFKHFLSIFTSEGAWQSQRPLGRPNLFCVKGHYQKICEIKAFKKVE